MSAEPIALVPGLTPAAPVMRVLSRFDSAQLETFIEIGIALLDLRSGDPDAEVTDAEDDFTTEPAEVGFGTGCPITDPGEAEEDMGEEERGEQATWHNGIDQSALVPGCMAWHHDEAEDDDPAGQADEDGVNTATGAIPSKSGPGCPISDPAEGREDFLP